MSAVIENAVTVEEVVRAAREQDRFLWVEHAKRKYLGEWWRSCDPYTLASMQLREPVLLIPFSRFHEAVELVLGREVRVEEFAAPEKLIDEIDALP